MPKRQNSFKSKKQDEAIQYLRPGPLLHWQSRSSPRIASPPVAQYNKKFNTRSPLIKHRRQPIPLLFQHTIFEEMDTSLSSTASSSRASSTPGSTSYTTSNSSSKRSSLEDTNSIMMIKTANVTQQSMKKLDPIRAYQTGGFFNEGDVITSSLPYNDDSDTDDFDLLLDDSQDDSMLVLSFPLPPPISAPKMLHHARSFNNFSLLQQEQQRRPQLPQHHSAQPQLQQHQQQQQQFIQPSPLRERRCKQPLAIKAPSTCSSASSTMKLRRVKSSSNGFFSPPPCPPPTSPLPELPLSSCGEVRQIKSPLLLFQQSQHQQQQEAPNWPWSSQSSQKSGFDSPPSLSSPCFSSSPCASPASSRGSSHRRSEIKSISSATTTTTTVTTTTKHAKSSTDWDEQLGAKLGLAFAFHLNLTSTTMKNQASLQTTTTTFQQSTTPFYQSELIDDDQTNHVYGFAL